MPLFLFRLFHVRNFPSFYKSFELSQISWFSVVGFCFLFLSFLIFFPFSIQLDSIEYKTKSIDSLLFLLRIQCYWSFKIQKQEFHCSWNMNFICIFVARCEIPVSYDFFPVSSEIYRGSIFIHISSYLLYLLTQKLG